MLPPRAYTFIGLNIVRILSIISLLLVFASSIVVLVHDIQAFNHFVAEGKANAATANSTDTDAAPSTQDQDYLYASTVPNQAAGIFWAVLNRLLIIAQILVLLLSELGWASRFFEKFFPVLGKAFGLGALGLIQCLLGAAILSHFVDEFALVSAFFLFSLGCLNILIGLIWRDSARGKRSVTSWRESKKDVLPKNIKDLRDLRPVMTGGSYNIASPPPPSFRTMDEKAGFWAQDTEAGLKKQGYGFGRQGEKAAAMKGFLVTKPIESLPRYALNQSPTGGSIQSNNPFGPYAR